MSTRIVNELRLCKIVLRRDNYLNIFQEFLAGFVLFCAGTCTRSDSSWCLVTKSKDTLYNLFAAKDTPWNRLGVGVARSRFMVK